MRRLLSFLVLALPLFSLQPLSCGGSAASDRCGVACKPPEGPCGAQDPAECEDACNAAVEGLEPTCAQCITENSVWKGHTCGADGCPVSFGSSSAVSDGSGGSTGCTGCSATCSGFKLAKISDSKCAVVCGAK